jgi:hypothetical protein
VVLVGDGMTEVAMWVDILRYAVWGVVFGAVMGVAGGGSRVLSTAAWATA